MTTKMRDRLINAFLGIITGGCVVLFGNWMTSRANKNINYEKKFTELEEKKLDKEDFTVYKSEHNQQHINEENRIIKNQEQGFDRIIKMMELLHKNDKK